MKIREYRIFISILTVNLLAMACATLSFAEPADWKLIESRNFKISYGPNVDINNVESRLKERILYFVRDTPLWETGPEERIANRLDALYDRVKELLDMDPGIPKINVKIFKDRKELAAEYYNLFAKNSDYRSFYVLKSNTIYTSEEDISDSVMAHEIGHAVIDHYFQMVPPGKVSEVIASYVDLNLEGE